MDQTIAAAVALPFIGTSLGALLTLLLKRQIPESLHRGSSGFAAGVMTAASVWSLLLPAIDQGQPAGIIGFLPVAFGFSAGLPVMLLTETAAQAMSRKKRGVENKLSGTAFLALAVTLHNVPEGLAVGVACAGMKDGAGTAAGALALSLGIALQNVPEGAIISMPLRADGHSRVKAILAGILSGAVEPVAALFALWASAPVVRLMPLFLSFAAGAMLCVTVQELIPDAVKPESYAGSVGYAAGFLLMMTLDVLL